MAAFARRAPSLLFVIALLAALSCRTPASITIEVTTDFACSDLHGATVTFAPLLGGEIDTKPETTATDRCDDHYVGQVVIIPSGSDDDEVAIRVVGGFGRDVASCTGPTPGRAASWRDVRCATRRTRI